MNIGNIIAFISGVAFSICLYLYHLKELKDLESVLIKDYRLYYLMDNAPWVIGIFTSLDKAKDSIKGRENEFHIITKMPVNEIVFDRMIFIDTLNGLARWKWNNKDKAWEEVETPDG